MQAIQSSTYRGLTIRQYDRVAVVEDGRGMPVHRSTVVPARAARTVADRAVRREVSATISCLAVLA